MGAYKEDNRCVDGDVFGNWGIGFVQYNGLAGRVNVEIPADEDESGGKVKATITHFPCLTALHPALSCPAFPYHAFAWPGRDAPYRTDQKLSGF